MKAITTLSILIILGCNNFNHTKNDGNNSKDLKIIVPVKKTGWCYINFTSDSKRVSMSQTGDGYSLDLNGIAYVDTSFRNKNHEVKVFKNQIDIRDQIKLVFDGYGSPNKKLDYISFYVPTMEEKENVDWNSESVTDKYVIEGEKIKNSFVQKKLIILE